nr:uncharacterized protein LOC105861746 isoform X2 [Microcebus murinus]
MKDSGVAESPRDAAGGGRGAARAPPLETFAAGGRPPSPGPSRSPTRIAQKLAKRALSTGHEKLFEFGRPVASPWPKWGTRRKEFCCSHFICQAQSRKALAFVSGHPAAPSVALSRVSSLPTGTPALELPGEQLSGRPDQQERKGLPGRGTAWVGLPSDGVLAWGGRPCSPGSEIS